MSVILEAMQIAGSDPCSPIYPRIGADASLWCHALVYVCGDLIHKAPAEHRGTILEQMQNALTVAAMRP
jgi:hypothetical protein